MKIVSTIEARMTSSRLPGKPLLLAAGLPMLEHLVRRLQVVESIDEIVLATTTNDTDDQLVNFAERMKISVFRGSENDVMQRVIDAAKSCNADIIVEITGDCPIIDPQIVEQTIRMFGANQADYVSNAAVRSYPDGMDTQVFRLDTLIRSAELTEGALDREHVTLHIRNNPEFFSHLHLVAPPELNQPKLGLTLDEEGDYKLLKVIIEHFYPMNPFFSCLEVINFLTERPHLKLLNSKVMRKEDT